MALELAPVPDADIIKVGQFLGIIPSTIREKGPEFTCDNNTCKCGNHLGFFDFVKTAFNRGIHDKKYMADFFSSPEGIEREMETSIVCSVCDSLSNVKTRYRYSGPRTCS